MLRNNYYDKNEIRVLDRRWINLQEYYEIEFWSKKFGVTPELLKLSVKESGTTDAEEVEKYIRRKYLLK